MAATTQDVLAPHLDCFERGILTQTFARKIVPKR
jgi:hypothetical protein